jgi:hypothetical protein
VIILALKISSEFKKNLIGIQRAPKNVDKKRSSEIPIVLEAPNLEGPRGKIPLPFMASPPLGISNIELLPKI